MMLPKKGVGMEKHTKGSKKHITSYERFKILKYLSLNFSITKISKFLGYNKSSIYREIMLNSIIEDPVNGPIESGYRKCKHIANCKAKGVKRCHCSCKKYIQMSCPLITRPYQTCNFCERKQNCKYEKRIYHPEIATDLARERFKTGKTKIRLSNEELKQFDSYISPLLINGQSPEAIKSYSLKSKFPVSTRTLRNYINKSILTAKNIDLRRKMSYSQSRYNYSKSYSHNPLKKIDHLFEDYCNYKSNHPDLITFQCDTVLGKRNDHKCLLTIHADKLHFQMYFLIANKTPCKVNNVFKTLQKRLGEERYSKIFNLILSDNGSEFDSLVDIETNEIGVVLSKVFYTRAYRSTDKAECERNHELFRYIKLKGKTLDTLDDNDVFLINSHINSYPRKSLGWKTPIEAMKEHFGEDIIELLGIKEIKRKDVILTAKLTQK